MIAPQDGALEPVEVEPVETLPVEGEPGEDLGSARTIVREWGLLIVGTLIVALLIRTFVLQSYEIPSGSMFPTLENGNRVVVNRLSYDFGEIERGQVIVFDKPAMVEGENDLIKRVIGLPGETIRLVDGEVYVDGLRVVEPYVRDPGSTDTDGPIPGCGQTIADPHQCVIPDGHVFVMGDNRTGSEDSRVFGPVDVTTIVGRAFWTVWPLTDLGQL